MLVGNVNNLRAYRKLRMQNVVLFSLLRASGFILDRRLQISKGMAQNTHISYLQANRKDSSLEKQSLHLFWRHICGWMTLYLSQWEPLCLQQSLASILPSRWGNHSDIIYSFFFFFFKQIFFLQGQPLSLCTKFFQFHEPHLAQCLTQNCL